MTAIRGVLGLLGLAGMAYSVYGLLTDDVPLVGVISFLIAVVVAHDLVLLPLAIGVGALVVRYVPAWARAAVQGGLFASAVVFVVSLPFVLGFGRSADNPSKQPLNYGRGLLIVLVVIWVGAAAWALRRRSRRTVQP